MPVSESGVDRRSLYQPQGVFRARLHPENGCTPCGSHSAPRPRWYCFHATGEATIALHGIAEQGFEVFYPLVRLEVPTRKAAKRIPGKPRGTMKDWRDVPLFPGYGFVRFDAAADQWRPIASTRGVRQLFSVSAEKPLPIRAGVVERIMLRAPSAEKSATPSRPVAPLSAGDIAAGERVEVMLGAFAGNSFRVSDTPASAADRIRVLMTLFGRDTEIEVERAHVRASHSG